MIHQFAIRQSSVASGATASMVISAGTFSDLRTDVTFSNSNGVSFGLNGVGVITATVATNYQSQGAYLTTAMASNRGSDFVQATAAFAGTNASGTINSTGISVSVAAPGAGGSVKFSAGTLSSNRTDITFSNSNGVSFGLNAGGVITATVQTNYLTTAMASDRGSDFVQATAAFAGTNASGTINSTGISVSVAAQSVNSVKFSAGTLSSNRTDITFSNSNGVSFGLETNGVITATIATTYAGTGYTTATTAGTNVVGTLNSAGLSQGIPAFLTTADLSQNSSKYAGTAFATTTSAGTAVAGTLNTSGLTLGVPPFLTTAMQSNAATISNVNLSAGTTSQNLSAFVFSNSNNVSFGLNGSTVTATATVASTQGSINMSAGTTSTNASAFTFSNSNNVSFGLGTGASAGNITASIATTYAGTGFTTATTAGTAIVGTLNTSGLSMGVPAFLTTAMASNAATISNINVSAGTTSNNLSAVIFSNSNDISFGLNASTITADIRNFQSYWYNFPLAAFAAVAQTQSTSYIAPFFLPCYISASYLRLPSTWNVNTATFATTANTTFTGQVFSTINAVVYSLGVGASSNSLQSVTSGSVAFAQKISWQATNTGSVWSVSQSITYPIRGVTSQFATNDATSQTNFSVQSSQWTAFTGMRYLDIPFACSFKPGAYWLMMGASSTTSSQGNSNAATQFISANTVLISQINSALGDLGIAKVASEQLFLGLGVFTTVGGGTTASLDLSNVSSTGTNPVFQIQFIRQV